MVLSQLPPQLSPDSTVTIQLSIPENIKDVEQKQEWQRLQDKFK